MNDVLAERRIWKGIPPGPPPLPSSIITPKPNMRKNKKKKKTKLLKPRKKDILEANSDNDERDSDSDSDTDDENDSGSGSDASSAQSSTSSGSSSSASFSHFITDGPRYAEDPRDRSDRKTYHKKKGIRGRGRGRKVKVIEAKHRDTSLDSFHSELFDIEQFEKTNGTSKAVRRLWKAIEELQKRVAQVENPDSGSSSEEKRKKRKKKGKGKTVAKKPLVEVEVENHNIDNNAPLEATTSLSKEGPNDGMTSEEADNKDSKNNKLVQTAELPEKDSNRNEIDTQEDAVEPSLLLKEEGKVEASDDEKASDGDDESSDYDTEDGEKQMRKFELKTQFFYRSDDKQRYLFSSTEIHPLIRVRWDDLATDGETNTIPVDAEGKGGKIIPGHIDIIEIFLESSVLLKFISEISNELVVSFNPLETAPPATNFHMGTISFYKPFRCLIQYRDIFQEKVKKLEDEENDDNKPDLKSSSSTASQELVSGISDDRVKEQGESLQYNLLEHLKVLLAFMDEYLAKPIKKYEQARTGKLKGIVYEDLWMLFRPGDVLYTTQRNAQPTSLPPRATPPEAAPARPMGYPAPPGPPILRQGFGRQTPQAYKIISIIGGRPFINSAPTGRKASKYSELKILCYYIDFNGYRFDCMADTFTFRPFDNEMPITDLEAYPLVYASFGEVQGEEAMLRFLETRGKSFIEVTEASHKLYEGVAYSATKEEINTPVIIDFALAYQHTPNLKPHFNYPSMDFFNQVVRSPRAEPFETVSRYNQGKKYDWYWSHQSDLTNKGRTLIIETLESYPTVSATSSEPVIPKLISAMSANGHIILLPGMVHGFALRNRKWVSLELTSLQDAQYEDGWKDLILPPGHKEMVRAVVENHATGSRSTAGMTKGTAEVDIVRGKGKGCIILLHGEPGVGKTSTAECVAAFTKRPLFPITCGDIGYEPDEVERNLEKHFNLAHKWGCVMLLDEADVFLAKRSREDIKRNGLVSVFLRILEYYPGILFLTTNRVGSFDDAFRSRLHLTLYYPKLDRKQTIQIFEMNLRRLIQLNSRREDIGQKSVEIQSDKIVKFAKKHWETLSWNGRQIRNAFQTALALAEFDVRDNDEKPAVMSKKQFKTIAKASMEFDDYLFHTHGGTDESANARREQVRWDYEIKGRPDKKQNFADSSSETTSDSNSSSSDGSEASDASDSDSSSSDSDDAKRRKRKKGKSKEKDKKSKRSEGKSKKSKSKKDKHT